MGRDIKSTKNYEESKVNVILTLSKDTYDEITMLENKLHLNSKAELLRKTLVIYRFLINEHNNSSNIYIEKKDKSIK